MNYALVGHGRMGQAIDLVASARGHRRVLVVDPHVSRSRGVRGIADARWRGIDLAFEFTEPGSARDNVSTLLERGIGVVCGTTGWDADDPELARTLRRSKAGLIVAPNFSVGMAMYVRCIEAAAAAASAAPGFDPWVAERHHRGKRDAPSGTALRLARLVAKAYGPSARIVEGIPDSPLEPRAIHLASIRAGHEPGRHEVGFDGPHDTITLVHEARGRGGFAEGAVIAGEWLVGRPGRHAFEDVIEDLLRGAKRRAGGGRRR